MALEIVNHRLVNPPGGDPGLYLDLVGLKRAVLFDIGEHSLSAADLLRVKDLCISHTHVDHWIGFDRMLRVSLGQEREFRIYGPPGMAEFVWHRIHGYVWNLTFEAHLRIVVHELTEDRVGWHKVAYSLADRFHDRQDLGIVPHGDRVVEGEGFHVEFAELDHSTPCLGYALVQHARYSFDPEKLTVAGISRGPGLAEMKRRFLAGEEPDRARELGTFSPERRIAYVTDTGYSDRSVAAVCRLANRADTLYCEATYANDELEKANAVRHLTAGQCAAFANAAHVRELVPFHFSRRYSADPGQILEEVEAGRRSGS